MNRKLVLLGFLAAFGAAGLMFADESGPPDEIVVLGVGKLGSFETSLELVNPIAAPMTVLLDDVPPETVTCPDGGVSCITHVTIPPQGSLTIDSAIYPFGAPDVLYVATIGTASLPAVRAIIANQTVPPQIVSLPTVSRNLLDVTNDGVLDFPGLEKSAAGHSNLILANVTPGDEEPGGPMLVKLTAFGGDGSSKGSIQFMLGAGPVFLIDAAAQLGVSAIDHGHLAAVKVFGSGRLWGVMTTETPGGGIAISTGATLSGQGPSD